MALLGVTAPAVGDIMWHGVQEKALLFPREARCSHVMKDQGWQDGKR